MKGWLLTLLAVASAGCALDISSFCSGQEGCRGGDAADVKACNDLISAQKDMAADIGCANEYADNFNCTLAHSTCHQTMLGPCATTGNCTNFGGGTCIQGRCVLGTYGLDMTKQPNPCGPQQTALNRCLSQ
jgi:hypothetical protein